MTIQGYKYGINDINNLQLVKQTMGSNRFLYNLFVTWWNDQRTVYKQFIKNNQTLTKDQIKEAFTFEPIPPYTRFSNDEKFSFIKKANSTTLSNTRKHFFKAVDQFFKTHDEPNYKARKDGGSATFSNVNNSIKLLRGSELLSVPKYVKKLGSMTVKPKDVFLVLTKDLIVKVNYHRELPKGYKLNSVTLSYYATKYYVSLNIEHEESFVKTPLNTAVGCDLGLHHLVITSDGQKFENPKYLNKYSEKLKKLEREYSRLLYIANPQCLGKNGEFKPGSKVTIRTKKMNILQGRIQKAHAKIRNCRKYNHYQIVKKLVDENQVIIFESLKVKSMVKNHKLAKAISDASWGSLLLIVEHMCKKYGREFHKINTYYASTQICHSCGTKNSALKGYKGLKIREWTCPTCGLVHDRDINASINIGAKGLKEMGKNLKLVKPMAVTK